MTTSTLSRRLLGVAVALLCTVGSAITACSEPRISMQADDAPLPTLSPWLGALEVASGTTEADHRLILERTALQKDADDCREAIVRAQDGEALPGAPEFQNNRALVLARAKAEPVLFLETPRFTGVVSRGVEARRRALLSTKYPRDMVRLTISTFADHPERLRELLLRDGYLYTDDPRTARLLSTRLTLEKLFREPKLNLMRGAATYKLEKGERGLYHYADGARKGERARLLLFDRVYEDGEDPGPPLHVDVRELAHRVGFEGMQIAFLGREQIVADLRFGDHWVPTLIDREGPNLSVKCYLIEPDEANRVGRARDEAYRRALVLNSLRTAIAHQVSMGLPFDEPKTEHGQQDGKLRQRFEQAYLAGRKTYRFNGDKYLVFDERGHAMSPQVCIDFVTESLERASGMHFAPEGQPPKKVLGALNFDEILDGHRRQEMSLRNHARANPHRLLLHDYAQKDWVRYENIDSFYRFLSQERDQLRPGDIVIIRGRAAWDRYAEVHTHTFFIYESDPMTGMPTLLAGNAGKPRIVTWDDEMLRAPKRSIRHRIRPNMEWLYDHVVLKQPLRGERWATPLSLGER